MKTSLLFLAALLVAATNASFSEQKVEEWVEGPPPPLEKQLKPSDLRPIKPLQMDQTCHPEDVDLYFVVDKSGSVGTSNFETVKQFLQDIVSQMQTTGPTRARIGAVLFDSSQHLQFNLARYDNSPANVINSAIQAMQYSWGGTRIADAMTYTAQTGFSAANGNRADKRNVMIVITDGQDKTDVIAAHQIADDADIDVVAIGVGSEVSRTQLLQIAGGDPSQMFDVATFDDLYQIIANVCKNVDHPCSPNPCLHGGTCSANADQEIACACTPDWTGPLCETATTNPCESQPCQNNGTCSNVGNTDYQCQCTTGFTGKDCHNPICPHGDFWCECDFGYTGPYCDQIINYCNNTNIRHDGSVEHLDICGPHGHCASGASGAICTCDPGWTGPQCNQDINDCLSNPCQNGATCENLLGPGYKCSCPALWTGPICDQKIDACKNLEIIGKNGNVIEVPICGEHGTCFNGPKGAKCLCSPEWTGKFCRTEIPFNCTYTDHAGQTHTYPHNATWVDDCNQCQCEYGKFTCAKSFWCPHKCAIYETPATKAANLPTHCPPHENCIPQTKECAAPNPTCAFPVGWCFPVGHIMIDHLTIPTNPPQGWQHL